MLIDYSKLFLFTFFFSLKDDWCANAEKIKVGWISEITVFGAILRGNCQVEKLTR